jgi:hypothetical protein
MVISDPRFGSGIPYGFPTMGIRFIQEVEEVALNLEATND